MARTATATTRASSVTARVTLLLEVLVLCGFLSFYLVSGRPTESAQSESTNRSNSVVGELLLVQAIFRHGDRTPISLYTNDKYNNYTWVDGLGMLTPRGKARMFHYGSALRQRYSQYLENILLRNVRAQSSPKRRCLETSLAVLAGLLPPTNTSTWSRTSQLAQLWTPIAVETVEPARAWLLNPDTECKAASAIKDALPTADAEMKKFLEENKDFVEKVSAKTGNTFPSWVQVGWIYDALFTEKAFFGSQFQLPDWLAQIGPDTLSRLKQFNDYQFTIFTKWPKYTKLRAGLLLQQTIDNMMAVANQKEQVSALNRKLFLYGTHDTMCSPISLALGYTTEQPTYGSGFLLELRSHSGQPQVHVFYANTTDNANLDNFNVHVVPVALNQSTRFSKLCPEVYCSLDNFAKSLKDFLVKDIEKECAL